MSGEPVREEWAALAVQDIAISRMDGVRNAFRIDALSPGINLVHGPNGIGKSRTAEAIQAVIWSDALAGRAEIVGTLCIDDSVWRVDVDMGRVTHQRDGVPQAHSMLAHQSDSHRNRYVLTLQDLLRADNRDFAGEIRQEAAGGFDLPGARKSPGVPETARFRRLMKELRALQQAKSEVVKLCQQDQALQHRELSLSGLRQDYDAAIAATQRIRMLEHAREYAQACDEVNTAEAAQGAYPDPLGRMNGNEYDRIQTLSGQLREENARRSQLNHEIDRLKRELTMTGFANADAAVSLIPALRDRLNRLNRIQSEWQQVRRTVESNRAILDSSRERLGGHLSDTQLLALNTDGLRALSDLGRNERDVDATLHVQQELQAWLGDTESATDLDQLRRGADLLAKYASLGNLEQANLSRLVRWALIAAGALIGIEAILLALISAPGFVVLGLMAIPLVWIAMKSTPTHTEHMEHIRRDYAGLGLEVPAAWSTAEVTSRLNTLRQNIARATLDQEKSIRWGGLARQRQHTESELAALASKRQDLVETFGDLPGRLDPESLRTIASSLETWRASTDALRKAQALMEETSRQGEEMLDAINLDLLVWGEPEARDASQATAAIESLSDRIEKATKVKIELDHARQSLDATVEPRSSLLTGEIVGIYESLGIEHGDELHLRELCGKVDAYLKAQSSLDEARVVAKTSLTRLDEAPDYAGMSLEHIDHELDTAKAEASRQEEIQKEISAVKAELDHARQQMQLEEALTRQTDALDALEQHRRDEYDEVAARQVFDFVQNQNHEVNRPQVFRVAETLFTTFTSGSYDLVLSDGPDPEFLSRDTSTGRSLQLHELSSGTRVQLLLAIRLAFIESMERGPQLPIILDEVLGNTDDLRATAIIDAAIDIARRGRQVVYFTAQRDEIGKWCSCLENHSAAPKWTIFDLADIRGRARAGTVPAFEWDPSVFTGLRIPDDADHAELRTLLNVPPINFRADRPGGIDLWYLIPDVLALEKLRRRGIRTWGQFCALHRSHHLDGIWSKQLYEQAVVRARIVETVCKQWRIGRPRPITRETLQQSGEITDTFWDRVVECAERHGWDGAALIEALHAGEVSRFYRSTTEHLEEWCREHGHITDDTPQSEEMIRAAAFSVANPEVERGLIAPEDVDGLLRSMTGDLVVTQ